MVGGAEGPRLVRSHLFRRPAQGRIAGGVSPPPDAEVLHRPPALGTDRPVVSGPIIRTFSPISEGFGRLSAAPEAGKSLTRPRAQPLRTECPYRGTGLNFP